MARKNKARAALPAGFTSLSDRAPIWSPEIGDTLQGVVTAKREMDARKAGRKKAKKGDVVRILTVADSDGVVQQVWESYALSALCDLVKPGDEVFLRLDAVKKKGAKKFKDFTIAHKAGAAKKARR